MAQMAIISPMPLKSPSSGLLFYIELCDCSNCAGYYSYIVVENQQCLIHVFVSSRFVFYSSISKQKIQKSERFTLHQKKMSGLFHLRSKVIILFCHIITVIDPHIKPGQVSNNDVSVCLSNLCEPTALSRIHLFQL